MKFEMLVATALCLLGTGCAPIFRDVPSLKPKAVWVEREATVVHDAIATMDQREVVQIDTLKNTAISADERVIWVSGIDIANSNLQRSHERIGRKIGEVSEAESAATSSIVTTHQFEIFGESLSAAGQLALDRFKAQTTDRYYVEFLSKEPMTPEGVEQTMAAWKQIAIKLKARGLNTTNVILGGSKFEQKANAIVLVKVGK